MIKRFEFEKPANKALMAEILTRRDRQPRAAFLSSLAAVMVVAISLTMVFGSLSTSAAPLEEKDQAYVSSVTDGEALPSETVTRVHTETQTENVSVYNYSTLISETPQLPVADNTDYPKKGKALFDQKKQRFQWQYKDELFTFFVKDNTVYRHSEKTGKTTVIFKGYGAATLFCVTDRYLFFGAGAYVNYDEYIGGSAYCYRADLLTGKILRLFNYLPESNQNEPETFVRFDGTDVVFTHFIVHEDGNYERIPDKTEKSNDEDETVKFDLSLLWNDDNTICAKDVNGNCYNLGISIKDIESLGFKINDHCKSWLYHNGTDNDCIFVSFDPNQDDSATYLWYYGRITDNKIKGGLILAELLNKPEKSFFMTIFYTALYANYDDTSFFFPIDYGKLTAKTKSEREYHSFYDDEITLAITYYPCNSLHTATPDSAD